MLFSVVFLRFVLRHDCGGVLFIFGESPDAVGIQYSCFADFLPALKNFEVLWYCTMQLVDECQVRVKTISGQRNVWEQRAKTMRLFHLAESRDIHSLSLKLEVQRKSE